ncbi:hypothetical protein ACES2J_05785 [Bdellovibrio bacteriovorus]|uniref:hypothetical protein n=1 Tax=Bdellovibrio bacteriovorus TaxID=959 RepID=UPI0035A6EFCB
MKALLFLLIAGLLLGTVPSHAKLQPLTDDEMSNVYGSADLASSLLFIFEVRRVSGQPMTGVEVMNHLQAVSKAFGITLENITVVGEKYGSLQMTVIKDGKTISTTQLPSHFDSIYIGTVRAGDGASLGSIEIQNLNIAGQITVTVH